MPSYIRFSVTQHMTTILVVQNDTHLLSYRSGGHKSDNGSHWAKVKVVLAGLGSFLEVLEENVSLPFPTSENHLHCLTPDPLSPSSEPTTSRISHFSSIIMFLRNCSWKGSRLLSVNIVTLGSPVQSRKPPHLKFIPRTTLSRPLLPSM